MISVIILSLYDNAVSLYLQLLGIGNYRDSKVLGKLRAYLCGISVDCLTACDDQIVVQVSDSSCQCLGSCPCICSAQYSVCYKDRIVCAHCQCLTKYILCLRKSHGYYGNLCAVLVF